MKTKRISLLALGLLALIVLPFIAGCGAKTNDIVEVSYVEKKEIDGSTMRVYAFQVKNFIDNRMIWGELEEFSRMQTYKPGDNTVIYFFEKKEAIPDLTKTGINLTEECKKYCIAGFWKYPDGTQVFTPFPFS